ncbi:MAG: hypothetical protein RL026_627 [Pseudomonadota bacterium]
MTAFKGQGFFRRLACAVQGLAHALRQERSLQTQAVAAGAVLVALVVERPPALWWAIALLAIGGVIAAELLNSAIEALADHLHPQHHPAIRIVKDVAAAAVTIASVVAAGVAIAFLLR